MIPRLAGVRYALPLREGGSLPAVVETEDEALYVVKFRGAGQGQKALVAEAIAAGLAMELDLPLPRPAIIELAAEFGRNEPDEEIQDILRGSVGLNFGLAYLQGALAFDPAVDTALIGPELAADIVWFDALITNVDRTVRNTNILVWQDEPWLIDHGASLYFHHRWEGWEDRIDSPFPQIKDHVLLHIAGNLREAGERLEPQLTTDVLEAALASVPDEWLGDEEELFSTIDEHRHAYVTYLRRRIDGPQRWLDEAVKAQEAGPQPYVPRVTRRVV